MKKATQKVLLGTGVLSTFAALPAQAATDYTSLTSAFSSADITTGLLAIGAVLAAIYTAWRGIKMVLGMMKAG